MGKKGSEKNKKGVLLNLIVIVLLLLLAGVFLYLLFLLGRIFVGAFNSSSPEIKAAIIAGVLTILVTFFTTIITKYFERKKEIEQEHRKQIAPIYKLFLGHIFNMVNSSKLEKGPISDKELAEFMCAFFSEVLIWSSDDFIKEYSKFSRKSGQFSKDTLFEKNILAYDLENILLAMRKDLGHKNKRLKKGDILGVFVKDLDTP